MDEGNAASIRSSKLKVSILSAKNNLKNDPKALIKCTGNIYYKVKNEDRSIINSDDEKKIRR
nr:hypothetical protein [uncultured Methanolobus sp.]